MFVDASVIVAVLARESDGPQLTERLRGMIPGGTFVSPIVRYEATLAMARVKAKAAGRTRPTPELLLQARETVDALLVWLQAKDVDITSEIGVTALETTARYGKLVGHPAALNFGDCFAYACAKSLGVALAYKGDDFTHTDLA